MNPLSLSDRMKCYEAPCKEKFDNTDIVIARIDGRGFSNFTKNYNKPFDKEFTEIMIEVTKALVNQTNAVVGYTQSDEISLIWYNDNPNGQIFFNGKIMKLTSICASIAAAEFNTRTYHTQLALFDCRVFTVPNKAESANYLLYRNQDCRRNSVSMATHSEFSHKQVQGKNVDEQKIMLLKNGIDWDNYPRANKEGTFVKRVAYNSYHGTHGETDVCVRHRIDEVLETGSVTFDELIKIVG